MLENNYKDAIPAFENYMKIIQPWKDKKAKKMLEFCNREHHIQYKIVMNHQIIKKADQAVILLDNAHSKADEDLKLEIDLTKQGLAKQIATDLEKTLNQ